MSETAKAFVDSAPKKEVIERVAKADSLERSLANERKSKKDQAIAVAAMGAEVLGSLAGGGIVGYMQANDYEEWIALLTVGAGAVAAVKRLEDPTNPYWNAAFATANGMGAALASGYSRDYFSGNQPRPMT